MKPTMDDPVQSSRSNRPIWIALIVSSGVLLTPFFACVTPFSALATLAALKLGWREGFVVLGLVWLANQAIGYAFLGYPSTWDSLAWGVAIGASTALAIAAATSLSTARPAPMAISLPFVAAFAAFELTLYAAGFILPGSDVAFSVSMVTNVFLINAATLCVVMIVYHLITFLGLQASLTATTPQPASTR